MFFRMELVLEAKDSGMMLVTMLTPWEKQLALCIFSIATNSPVSGWD